MEQRPGRRRTLQGLVALIAIAVLTACGANDSTEQRSPGDQPTSHAGQAATDALALLGTLPVKGRAPKTGYSRAQFGQTWTDDVTVQDGHNGCDTATSYRCEYVTRQVNVKAKYHLWVKPAERDAIARLLENCVD